LDALPKSFGGASGLLQFVDASAVTEYFSYGSDPSYEASFMAYYGKLNPYPAVGFHRLPVGTVLLADDYVSAVELKGTEFFHEWMTPQGITPDHFAISLYNEGSKAALLVVAPHAVTHIKHRERYTSQLQLLAPHMVRAMDIGRRVSGGR